MHLLSMIGDRRTKYLRALLQNHRQTSLKLTVIIRANVTHFKRLSLFQTCLSLSIEDLKNLSFPSTYPLPSFHVTIRVIQAQMVEWFLLVSLDVCHFGRHSGGSLDIYSRTSIWAMIPNKFIRPSTVADMQMKMVMSEII